MIGGTVIKVKELPDKIWVNCEEDCSTSQCAIYVEKNAKSKLIEPGDSVWWQGIYAMWTPYCNCGNDPAKPGFVEGRKAGKDYDIKIPRIGFSGVSEPPCGHTEEKSQ